MKAFAASAPRNESQALFICSVASFLEILTASLITLTITRDPKNAVVLGLSLLRLGLLGLMLGVAALALAVGVGLRRRGVTFSSVLRLRETRPLIFDLILLALGALLAWGWLALFSSAYLYGRWMYVFDRLRPLGAALGLSAAQVILVGLGLTGRLRGAGSAFKDQRGLWIAAGAALVGVAGLALFIAVTRIGLVHDVTFWNMPGMPLSGVQYAGLLALVAVGIFAVPLVSSGRFWRGHRLDVIVFAVLYLAAVVVWGSTPMLKHAVSLQPTAPAYQPYPTLDARVHDSGAIAILKGYGILFKAYTDKPLYMVFLSLLHRAAGYDYNRITLLQVACLALIPALLYVLGVAFQGRALGLFIALAVLLRQRNAIDLSYVIDSANPKLFLTEVPTLLGLALVTLLVFLWLRSPKPRLWMALLAGGALGAVSLVRANPMLLLPALSLLALLAMAQVRDGWSGFLRSLSRWAGQAALFGLGFMLLVAPWVVTGVNANGQPWLILKFLDVINVRYSLPSGSVPGVPGMAMGGRAMLTPALSAAQPLKLPRLPEFIAMHTLNNVVGAVIALPDSLVYEDLAHLSQRPYWQAGNNWQGALGGSQSVFVALNLALIALGLGYSWKVFRWAGLTPLLVFLVYALALGFARNSGSRYLVPMDWVVFFYFGLGLVTGLTFLRGLLGGTPLRVQPFASRPQDAPAPAPWKGLALTFAALVVLASLVPVANVLMINPRADQANAAWTAQALAAAKTAGAVPPALMADSLVVSGEVFYPYNSLDGNFSFGILNKSGLQTFTIPQAALAKDLTDGERAFAGIQKVNGEAQVRYLYAGSVAAPQLLWVAEP